MPASDWSVALSGGNFVLTLTVWSPGASQHGQWALTGALAGVLRSGLTNNELNYRLGTRHWTVWRLNLNNDQVIGLPIG